jgi:hypothetical protein
MKRESKKAGRNERRSKIKKIGSIKGRKTKVRSEKEGKAGRRKNDERRTG